MIETSIKETDFKTVLDSGALANGRPLVLDFDETLWLRNSTEEFIRFSAVSKTRRAVLIAIDRIGVWRFARSRRIRQHMRDWMRVSALVSFPGTLSRWNDTAAAIGQDYANKELLRATEKSGAQPVVVSSYGFAPIIRPLLNSMGLHEIDLVAAPISSGIIWRLQGKLHHTRAFLGEEMLAEATVISDSEDDRDILVAGKSGFLVKWQDAKFDPYKV